MEGSDITHKSKNTAEEIKNFVNPFSLTSSSSNLKCSFNGGCELSMTGTPGI